MNLIELAWSFLCQSIPKKNNYVFFMKNTKTTPKYTEWSYFNRLSPYNHN